MPKPSFQPPTVPTNKSVEAWWELRFGEMPPKMTAMPKKKGIVFQPSIFRGGLLNFGGCSTEKSHG